MRTNTRRIAAQRFLATLAAMAIFFVAVGTVGAQTSDVQDPLERSVTLDTSDEVGPGIIGGSNAKIKDHPYFVKLTYQGRFFCGGTLIRDRWVLTAAHCLADFDPQGDDIVLVFGDNGSTVADSVQAERLIPHRSYNPFTLDNDIGLVRLARAPKLSSPLIATTGFVTQAARPKIGSKQPVIGWGLTSPGGDQIAHQLQKAVVEIKSCLGDYGSDNDVENICAGSPGMTSCNGDSGGPLLVGGKVAGIVSYGTPNCVEDYGVYTRVSHHTAWIQKVMAPKCAGKPVTVFIGKGQKPTSGNDVILGTPQDDEIQGSGGADIICGGGGDDTLKGGAGRDRLIGGPGKDTCIGGPGRDRAKGCEVVRGATNNQS